MKIAILGAGFTGLAAAYRLTKQGYDVTVFEKDSQPGGLAIGYKEKGWDWSLEKHYHHWFTNDANVLGLARELQHDVLIRRPKTSVFVENASYQLDSPAALLSFKKLPVIDRLRMGLVLALLRYNPFWQPLENIQASTFLPKAMGQKGYQMLWEPQLANKFGSFIDEMSLAWFWARIKKRTPNLAYPQGGFLHFANILVKHIEKNGGKIFFNREVTSIKNGKSISVTTTHNINNFDQAIVTLPSFLFIKLAPQLPSDYQEKLKKLKGLGAINLVLRLTEQFLKDNTYWLSICENGAPVMAIVEHTNFMDKKYYNNEHIVYLGNYLPFNHQYFSMTEEDLLATYEPLLRKINKDFKKNIIGVKVFSVPFAQPIIPLSYSRILPSFETPLNNVYLANIQQVYPWDRGTNYAVELGEKVASLLVQKSHS